MKEKEDEERRGETGHPVSSSEGSQTRSRELRRKRGEGELQSLLPSGREEKGEGPKPGTKVI